MNKVLLVDYDFKITNSASGQIARVFWNANSKLFDTSVICAKGDVESDNNCTIIEVADKASIRHFFGLLREFGLPDLCHMPDQKRFSWQPFVMRKAKKVIMKEQFDIIHSISCPETAHLIAYKLKCLTGLPWIAQFNDPWVENEIKKFRFSSFRKRDLKLERLVAENADIIIHSNKVIVNSWKERYGENIINKIKIFPLSFNIPNLPLVKHNESPDSTKYKISIYHIGHLYGARSARTLFMGLASLFESNPEYISRIEVSFIGSLSEEDKKLAEKLCLNNNINYLGVMPPDKLLDFYNNADVFLVIDMEVPESPSFPSKLLLYHYFRKPILSITTEKSIIEDDMIVSGHHYYYYGDVEGVAGYLKRAIEDYPSLLKFDHNHWKEYTVENVTNLYLKELNNLLLDK